MAAVAPTVRGGAQVVYGESNWATSIQGVTPEYLRIRDYCAWRPGASFTDQDVGCRRQGRRSSARPWRATCSAARDPVEPDHPHQERAVHRDRACWTPKGQSPSGQDQDDVILIPISTAKQKVLGTNGPTPRSVGALMVQATGAAGHGPGAARDGGAAAPAAPHPARRRRTTSPSATCPRCSPPRKARRA